MHGKFSAIKCIAAWWKKTISCFTANKSFVCLFSEFVLGSKSPQAFGRNVRKFKQFIKKMENFVFNFLQQRNILRTIRAQTARDLF